MSEKDASTRRLIREMSYGRDDYKSGLRRHIIGALNEHCKALLGRVNGLPRWVDHWQAEADRLLLVELPQTLTHQTRFRNRLSAAMEEVAKIRDIEAGFRRRMAAVVARDHGLERLDVTLTSQDLEPFWKDLIGLVEETLG